MAAFNFPNSPSTNDLHTENGVTFKWNGTIWLRVGNSYSDISTLNVTGISTLTGIVKIGTNTAGRAGADELTIGNASGDIGITLRSGTSNEGNIYFADSTSSGNAEQRGIIRFDHSTDSLQFFTANGNNWPTEKLRITSAGRVGINTNNPGSKLTIWADDSDVNTDVFQIRGKTGAFNIRVNDADASNPEWAIRTYSSEPIVFMQGTTERARFDSSGNLAINKSSTISAKLHIGDTGNNGALSQLIKLGNDSSNAGTGSQINLGAGNGVESTAACIGGFYDGTGTSLIVKTAATYANQGTVAERLRITSTGNVGINTTNPTSDGGTTLEVYNATNPTIRLNDGGQYKSLFQLRGNDLEIRGSNGNVEFYTGNADGASSTERLRITSTGLVGINCTPSANHTLHVKPGGSDAWVVVQGGTNQGFQAKKTDGTLIGYYGNGGGVGYGVNDNAVSAPAGNLIFQTGGTSASNERMRIRSDGHVIIDTTRNGYGGLKIYDDSSGDYHVRYIAGRNQGATAHVFMRGGRAQNNTTWVDATATEHARIHRGGISFNGDTAADNTLNDYEEGSWTPNVTVWMGNTPGSGGTPTVSSVIGKYVKIGKLVTCYAAINFSAGTSAGTSGYHYMSGLPFSATNYNGGGNGGYGGGSINNQQQTGGCYVENNGCYGYPSSSTISQGTFYFNFAYLTDS